jgi:menaquinone-9 beta-reductase
MDVHPERLGAQIIHSVRVATRDVLVETPLPAPAVSLTRQALDEALLQRAQRSGATVLRGYMVEHLSQYKNIEEANSWRAGITNSAQVEISIHGREIFLATGKHDLRGWSRATGRTKHTMVAMKMYFTLAPEQQKQLAGYVELVLYPGGYAGLQMVEDDRANLCVLVRSDKLRSIGGNWNNLLGYMQRSSVHLARRLAGAAPGLHRPLALSGIPYGYCADVPLKARALWRLGDQAAVIPSFCGEGLAMALHTAHRAAQHYLSGSTAAEFHEEIRNQFDRRLSLATSISRSMIAMPSLAQALRLWPSVLSWIFAATRVPPNGLLKEKR